MNIKKKILYSLLIVTMLPLFVLSYLFFVNYKSSIESELFDKLNSIARLKVANIENVINNTKRDAQLISKLNIFNDLFPSILKEAKRKGKVVHSHILDMELDNILNKDRFMGFRLLDLRGRTIYSYDKICGKDEIDKVIPGYKREWIEEWKGVKDLWLSDVFKHKAHGYKLVMYMISPIRDQRGTIIGFAAYGANMEELSKLIMDSSGLGLTGEVVIAKKYSDTEAYFVFPLRSDRNAASKSIDVLNSGILIGRALKGESGHGTGVDYIGRRVLGVWGNIPSIGWSWVIKVDEKEALSKVYALRSITFLLVLATLLLLFVISYSVARSISDPIQKLTQNVSNMPKDDNNPHIVVNTNDEVGVLSRSFAELVKELEADRERFKSIAIGFKGYVWEVDASAKYVYMSEGVKDVLGYEPEELVGKTPFYITSEEEAQRLNNIFMDIASVGKSIFELEKVNIRKDGKRIIVSTSAVPIFGDNGVLIGYRGIDRDVSDKKEYEKKIREQEVFMKTVLDNLPIGIAVNTITPTVEFQYMNDNFTKIYHTTREALADPNSFWEAAYGEEKYHKDIKKRVLEDCASGDPRKMQWSDVPIYREGKIVAYISAANTLIEDKNLMVSTVLDVTQRKRAIEALKKSEEKFYKAFNNSPGIMFVADIDGRIIEANQGLCQIQRRNKEDLIGKTTIELGIWADLSDRERYVDLVIKEGRTKNFEAMFRKASGELFPGLISGEFVYMQGQECVLSVINDISDRKKAEETRKKLDELELERQAAQIKEKILAMTSHDLKSPLSIIKRSMVLLLEREDIASDVKSYAELSLRQVNKGLKYIGDFISIQKFKTGAIKLDLSRFKFSDLVESISKDFKFRMEHGGLGFTSNIPDNYVVNADYIKMDQVLSNLIDNSMKHTPKGGTIDVSASIDGCVLMVRVSDTGEGIPEDRIPTLFEYYEQVYDSDKITGMGMGLPIAKYIVELHGGRIWVEPRHDKGGATICFTIPSVEPMSEHEACVANNDAQINKGHDGKTILVIDDAAEDRLISRMTLEQNGYKVLEAEGWLDGIKKVRSSKIDLALIDVSMPEMSGIELLEVIRRERSIDSLPVVLFSSKEVSANICKKAGANAFVSKDDPNKMLSVIKNIFSS